MMKKTKGILALFCIVCILITCLYSTSCSNSSEANYVSGNSAKDKELENKEEEIIEEPNTEQEYLSEDCDLILAEGYEDEDNYYELVANKTEDYNGVKYKVGVIKNNNWLIKPTSKSPFVRRIC